MAGPSTTVISSNALANRLGNTVPVTLNGGGTFAFTAITAGSSIADAGSIEGLTITGTNTSFLTTNAASGTGNTSTFTIGTLTQSNPLATLSAAMSFANASTGRVALTNTPAGQINGIIPWGIETTTGNFLSDQGGFLGGFSSVGGAYTTGTSSTWVAANNVELTTGTMTAVNTNLTINSLSIKQSAATTLDLGGNNFVITSGGILSTGNFASTIRDGNLTTGAGNQNFYLWNTGNVAQNITANITDNGSPVGVVKAGANTSSLGGVNTYSGPTTVELGTLNVAGGGSIATSSTVTVLQGAFLTVASGGDIAGNVIDDNAISNSVANVTNSGTIGGTLTIAAPAPGIGATYQFGGNADSGIAELSGGSTTGPVQNEGNLIIGQTNPTLALSVGTISGTGAIGVITDDSTDASGGGNTLTFAAGSSFAQYATGANGGITNLTTTGGASAVTFTFFGYNTGVGTQTTDFSGGNWVLGAIGQNNTGAQSSGTFTLTNNASVTINGNGYDFGNWIASSGTLSLTGAVSEQNNTGLSLALSASGSGVINGTAGLTLGNSGGATASTANSLSIASGGKASFAGNLIMGSGSANATFTETNATNLSGGKLLVNGIIEASSQTNVVNSFNWTGGQLSALTITPSAGFNGAGSINSTTLTNSAGILAPGDIGTAGETTISGNYVVSSTNTALDIDLAGTTQGSGYQTGSYDFLNITGTSAIAGALNVNLVSGYNPTGSYTVLQTAKSVGSLSGTFDNTEIGKTAVPYIAINGTSGLTVTYTAGTAAVNGSVVLGGLATGNTYTSGSGGAWDAASAANWSAYDPGSSGNVASGAIAVFADGAGTGSGPNGVTLNSSRDVQGILFASGSTGKNYSINNAGSGSLILDNTANAAAASITDSSHSGNTNAINVPITLNSNLSVTVSNAANTLNIGGAIGDGGTGKTLTLSGAGTLNLSGANTYSGLTTVSSGALNITGTVAGALTVSAGSASVGSNGLLSGAAIVNGGTLNANGLLNSTVTIGSAGTLTGSGTIGGLLTLNSGASTINLKNGSDGTLTLSNGLTLNGGNSLEFDLGGGSSDSIALTGGSYSFAGPNDTISLAKIGTITSGTYNLITGAGSISAGNFVLSGTTLGGQYLSLASNAGTLQLIAVSAGLSSAYWSGALGSTWSTLTNGTSNWNTDQSSGINAGAIPLPATDVYFAANGVGSPINTTLGANFSIDSLNFLANVGTVTIGGANTLTIAASGITNAAGNSVTLNPEMTVDLGASQTWTNNSALFTVASTVTDSGSGYFITTSGSGVTVLSGSNSYAGNILNNGELSVSSNSNLGGASNALTFNGGTLQVAGLSLTSFGSHSVTFNSGKTVGLDINNAANVFTVSQVLNQGAGGLNLYGAGTVALTASNTYTGNTTIYAGTLELGNGGTAGALSNSSAITDNANLTFNRSNNVTQGTDFSTAGIGGTGSVTWTGPGLLTLNAANTFSGGLIIDSGTVSATTNAGALGGASGAGNVSLASGSSATLLGASLTFANPISLAGGGTLTLGQTAGTNNTPTFSGGVTGSGNLVFNDTGTGTLTVSTGLVNNGGTIGNNSTGAGQVTLSANLGSSVGVLTENSASSQLNLTGSNSAWSGGLTIAQGTVNINAPTTYDTLGTGTLTLGAAASSLNDTLALGNSGTNSFAYTNPINVLGTGVNTISTSSGQLTDSGNVTLNSDTLTLLNTNGSGTNLTLSGTIGGTGNIILLGNGAGGQNNLTGYLNITGTVTNQGTSSGASTISGNIGANVTSIIQNSASSQLNISATGAFTGAIVANAGTIGFANANSIPNGAKLSVNNGATINTGNNNSNFTGTVNINSGTYQEVNGNGLNSPFGGTGAVNTGATINLGSAGSGSSATINIDGGNITLANPINVLGAGTNLIEEQGNSEQQDGTITLNGGDTINLTVLNANPVTPNFGIVTGTGNAIINQNNIKNFGTNTDTLSAFNNVGTVTVNGNSTAGTALNFSGALGAGVTSLIYQAGTTFTSTLSAADTSFAGTVVETSGKLAMGNASALNVNNAVTVSGGTLDLAGFNETIGSLSSSGSTAGVVTNSSTAKTLTIGGSATNTFGGTITGAIALSVAGTTNETLTGTNTYTGATTIGSGATLQLGTGASGQDGTIASSTGITDNGSLIYDRSGNLSTALGIGGSGTLTVSGAGSQTFTGALSYSGATTINAGATMQLGNGSVSGSDSSIDSSSSVADNGTLVYNYGGTEQSNQSINGSGNLTVSGPGSLTLNKTSGYTGTTTVNGTLIVAGALSGTPAVNVSGTMEVDGSVNSLSTTTLNGNGTLEGAGSVGAVTANGGNIAPGAGITGESNPVNLTLAGNMTLSGSTNFNIRLGTYNYNDNDSVTMTSGTAILNGANLVLSTGGAYSGPSGLTYIILYGGYNAGTSGTFGNTNGLVAANYPGGTDIYQIVYGYTDPTTGLPDDVAIEWTPLTAVPEPGTWAMIFSGAGMLIAWQRSRRRKHIHDGVNN